MARTSKRGVDAACPSLQRELDKRTKAKSVLPPNTAKSQELGLAAADRELDPVVVMVNVTGTLVVDGVKFTVAGLKLQVLCGGKFVHMAELRVVDPVNPF